MKKAPQIGIVSLTTLVTALAFSPAAKAGGGGCGDCVPEPDLPVLACVVTNLDVDLDTSEADDEAIVGLVSRWSVGSALELRGEAPQVFGARLTPASGGAHSYSTYGRSTVLDAQGKSFAVTLFTTVNSSVSLTDPRPRTMHLTYSLSKAAQASEGTLTIQKAGYFDSENIWQSSTQTIATGSIQCASTQGN